MINQTYIQCNWKGSEMLIKLLFQCYFINPSANSSAVQLPEFKLSLSEREKASLIWINIFIGTVLKLSMKLPNTQKAIPTCICTHISLPYSQSKSFHIASSELDGWMPLSIPHWCVYLILVCRNQTYVRARVSPRGRKPHKQPSSLYWTLSPNWVNTTWVSRTTFLPDHCH